VWWDRHGVPPSRERPSQRRSLQPAVQRSHDERCPSGSGWGKPSLYDARKGASERGRCRQRKPPVSPGPRNLGRWRLWRKAGLRLRTVRRDGAARAAHRDSDPCAVGRGSDDRAVVLAGCCGCRSRRAALGPGRKAVGLALWLARLRVRAPWAKGRWKPVRGGESHEHASSETGGGLLVIPRAGAQAPGVLGGGSTRRQKAS